MNVDFLKKKVFQVDGITLTVLGLIVIAFVIYWFFLRRK